MGRRDLIIRIEELHKFIDDSVDELEKAALEAQAAIYKALLQEIERFQISDGRFVVNQSLPHRLAAIESKMESILGKLYIPKVSEYLGVYKTIEETNISLQKSYNDLSVDIKLLTPARKTVYETAKHYLSEGLRDIYIQPAKYLLMQQVTNGISIKDSRKVLSDWDKGKAIGVTHPMPNLGRYAVQISRDSAYKYNGAINDIIATQYDLKKFIYVGDVIEHSRPLCKHLVGLRRDIELSEMPSLLKKYPQGLYPNTTKDNFVAVCGGYSCRHTAMPVA